MTIDLNTNSIELCLSPRRGEAFFLVPLPDSPKDIKYPEIRPSWWDETHCKLVNLVNLNKKKSARSRRNRDDLQTRGSHQKP